MTRNNIIYAREVEDAVIAITRQTGINLESFLDFFQNKWLLCKLYVNIN